MRSACVKWGLSICVHEVNVYTDHQPLETIFKKPLHAINYVQEASSPLENDDAAAMEQRQRYITLAMLADTLSRPSFLTVNDSKQTNFEIFRIDIDSNIGSPQVTYQTVIKVIKAATASHPTLCSPTFSVRPRSSVGRVTIDLIRRSWVRFPPRSKDFFFTSCGSLIPFTRANAQWVIHNNNNNFINLLKKAFQLNLQFQISKT